MAFVSGGIALAKYTGAPVACYNQGDAPTPVQITITGPCTNPKLTKTSTGEYIRIIKTLASGDVLTIDTSMGKKTVYFTAAGGSPVNAIANLDLSSTMFSLDLGYNAMQLTDDASSTSKLCTVKFTNRYGGA
jgi:phage-related protein